MARQQMEATKRSHMVLRACCESCAQDRVRVRPAFPILAARTHQNVLAACRILHRRVDHDECAVRSLDNVRVAALSRESSSIITISIRFDRLRACALAAAARVLCEAQGAGKAGQRRTRDHR
jgi:hypothetical protein